MPNLSSMMMVNTNTNTSNKVHNHTEQLITFNNGSHTPATIGCNIFMLWQLNDNNNNNNNDFFFIETVASLFCFCICIEVSKNSNFFI